MSVGVLECVLVLKCLCVLFVCVGGCAVGVGVGEYERKGEGRREGGRVERECVHVCVCV